VNKKTTKKEKVNNKPKNSSDLSGNKNVLKIDAYGVYYRDLNTRLRRISGNGIEKIELHNVYGQRYIGTDLDSHISIDIFGTPGNDLGAFMRGPTITVHGNVQDGCGNTMDHGQIIVHGRAGDLVGHSMRGGKIFIRDDAGYRVGIHMKEYLGKRPAIVIGGTAQDFLGEYMAGGVLVVLGLNMKGEIRHNARFVGTGMHGGTMYIRGEVRHLGEEVEVTNLEEADYKLLKRLVNEFAGYYGLDATKILEGNFNKLTPVSSRPYGKLYAY
jgi:glutamate synthase domain-containing protein 3